MGFYNGPVPQVHQTGQFTFRPLTPEYTDLDYAALMASKTILREWSNSPWPQDDFTLDANRKDLQRHHDEFQRGEAYTYTVLNPDENRIEGCLYIYPLAEVLGHFGASTEVINTVEPGEANLSFWIRADRLDDEGLLLKTIVDWLEDDWQFPRVTFATYDNTDRQRKLFEALGMRVRFRLPRPGGVTLLLYHFD
jgi:hypothetical protein